MKQKEFANGLQCFKEQKIGKLQIIGFVQYSCSMKLKNYTKDIIVNNIRLTKECIDRLEKQSKQFNVGESLNEQYKELADWESKLIKLT